jgi:two-component system, OmpR family, response regulator
MHVKKYEILVVEDDTDSRELLRESITIGGYSVTTAEDGLDALNKITKNQYDLIVSDINMPKLDGYQLIQKLRESNNETPILVLSARSETVDKNLGLRLGADDYMTKPFSLEEILLRINAILRRAGSQRSTIEQFSIGDFEVHHDNFTISFKNKVLELSPTEYRLLVFLLQNPTRVITKKECLSHVWGIDFSENFAVVDTYVSYLRKKLKAMGFEGLQTVRGIGLKMEFE